MLNQQCALYYFTQENIIKNLIGADTIAENFEKKKQF